MVAPLMPKATAVWLIENTALSFEQIADFCELHALEVQAIADEEVAVGIVGSDPIVNGQLTKDEIARCEKDADARLEMAAPKTPRPSPKTKGPRYTPIAMRQERPDAIAWLLRHYPELSDAQISKLVGTTKTTITAVRDRTHWKGANIKPVDPVDIGICTYEELLAAVQLARKRQARAEARAARDTAKREREAVTAETAATPDIGGDSPADAPLNPYAEHLPMGPAAPGPSPAGNTEPSGPPADQPDGQGPEAVETETGTAGSDSAHDSENRGEDGGGENGSVDDEAPDDEEDGSRPA